MAKKKVILLKHKNYNHYRIATFKKSYPDSVRIYPASNKIENVFEAYNNGGSHSGASWAFIRDYYKYDITGANTVEEIESRMVMGELISDV